MKEGSWCYDGLNACTYVNYMFGRASPAGRYQTSWIFCSAGNWTDELVPDIWANELMSLLREQYPRETAKIVI